MRVRPSTGPYTDMPEIVLLRPVFSGPNDYVDLVNCLQVTEVNTTSARKAKHFDVSGAGTNEANKTGCPSDEFRPHEKRRRNVEEGSPLATPYALAEVW